MTKTKSTKRALLMSGLALLMCVSMLIGSTFAWFTDSVTSAGNIIKSGTLDVTMEWLDGTVAPADEAVWIDASEGAIFDYDLWEPGYTEVRHIKIANEGTLALKYQLHIVANGEVSKLADVIDVYYIDPATQITDRAQLTDTNKIGTLTEVLANISTTASGNLLAGENHTITLALKMQESAGNEYQDLEIGSSFAVQLLATQLTFENDSFNNQYDADAAFGVKVSTADEFVAALKNGGLIDVQDDITFTDGTSVVIPEGTVTTLSLNGHTLTNPVQGTAAFVNKGSLTVNGGTIVNENIDAQGAAAIHNYGTLVLNDVNVGSDLNRGAAIQNKGGDVVINGGFFATMTRAHASNGFAYVFINNAGTMEINNAEVNGLPNGIFYADAGTIDVNGGTYIIKDGGNTWYVAYAGGDSKINLNSGLYKWYKLYCDAATTGNVVVSDECIINWGDNASVVASVSTVSEANAVLEKLADGKDVALVLTADVEMSKIDLQNTNGGDVTIIADGNTITSTDLASARAIQIEGANRNINIVGANIVTKQTASDTDSRGVAINNGDYNGTTTVTLKDCTLDMASDNWAYGVNLPAGVNGVNLVIDNCTIEGAVAINVWGDNNTITITNSTLLTTYDYPEWNFYASIVRLNNDGTNISENNTVTIANCHFDVIDNPEKSGTFNGDNGVYAVADLGVNNTVVIENCTYGADVTPAN